MIENLTGAERRTALLILAVIAIVGLVMAVGGSGDPMGTHGFIVIGFACVLLAAVGDKFYAPEPPEERLASYFDDPTKAGIIISLIWAVIGMGMGLWVALQLAWPDLRFDAAWSSFGRLRPLHTSGVIFGFGGNVLIATSFHVMQRTSRARLPGQLSPWFVLLGFNLFCIVAASGYLMGVTQSKEYAEPEWYADIWLVVVWVTTSFSTSARSPAATNRTSTCPTGTTWPSSWLSRFCTSSTTLRFPPRSVPPRATPPSPGSGRDDAMVVWPQRGRLLPDGRFPRHALLLPAEAGRAPDLSPTACRSSASGASPSSTSGLARITCITRRCRSGCRRWA